MMTTTQWLKRFQAGAGQLPGWHLYDGHLRLTDAQGDACPLRAQWNFEHPTSLVTSNAWEPLAYAWWGVLSERSLHQLIFWADRSIHVLHRDGIPMSRTFVQGRNRLLAACHLPGEVVTL